MIQPGVYKWAERLATKVSTKNRPYWSFFKKKNTYEGYRKIGETPDYNYDSDYDLFGWYDIQCGDR